MEFHPVANIFPLLQGQEFEDLRLDIAKNGLIEPIWLHPDGRIIDGRNRWRACDQIGIKPDFRTWNGQGSLIAFVVSLNLHRRHLDSSQKAFISLDILPMLKAEARERQLAQGERGIEGGRGNTKTLSQKIDEGFEQNDGRATQQAAQLLGTNRQYVSDAKGIQEKAPDLASQCRNGKLTISKAKKELRKRETLQREKIAISKNQATDWVITDSQNVVKCDALITDPPYGILGEEWEPQDLERFTRDWLAKWNDCGADFVVSFWSQEWLFEGRKWFDESLSNYEFKQVLIWHYPNNKSPQSRQMFKQTYEPIFFYRRLDSDKPVKCNGSDWGDDLIDLDCLVEAVPQSNFNDVNMKQHPAQKPLRVMRWLVSSLAEVGDLVCDPFCGSGTTGIASIQLKRRFHGIDIDSEYRELSKKRISTYG